MSVATVTEQVRGRMKARARGVNGSPDFPRCTGSTEPCLFSTTTFSLKMVRRAPARASGHCNVVTEVAVVEIKL